MKKTQAEIIAMIKRIQKKRGWNDVELAIQCNKVHPTSIFRWRIGASIPQDVHVRRLEEIDKQG